ncbi:PREDICTED: uncharacterized protein LOC108970659 isoform X1 [Bactrocera latifrons]|uniref:uncharacterized protein LOC108970659 isoform X1 n=2 Tax=Bactrocera latifrons TaxID=174628 RepID=UPI0008DE2F01|nr:PREDICTED: uncharacterized protein LOC108970659 isoform X1 [Bactrocera latifrons]
MIKFVRQKSREHSVKASKSFFKKKGESNDSGTESDGDVLDVDKHRPLDLDMETSLSSCADVNSPTTDTACSSSASSAMMCQSHLLYDQHSSEEELEVINGPSSVAAAEAASNVLVVRGTTSSLISERGSSSLEPEELFGEASTSKRSSSTLVENRKRSLAHSSDDDQLRNFLEPVLTPVNFRTSPPLEAFKPNRSHKYRSTTPLILSEARCGIENIKLCDNSVNDENGEAAAGGASSCAATAASGASSGNAAQAGGACAGDNSSTSVIKVCTSSLKMSNSSHHIYQPQPKYNFHYNSSRSSPASTTGLDAMEVRSVSPPAKLFHSARSPHRRPIRTQHATQRLQRPHRPCLDFDKMQQLALPITKTRN